MAQKPLRAGETFADLEMPEPYTPSAPTGVGTDDYRCFLLDPELAEDAFLTGVDVLPGNPDVVHHVIMFQVPPDRVAQAKPTDAASRRRGLDLLRRLRRGLAGGVAGLGAVDRRLGAGRRRHRAPQGLRRSRSPPAPR